MCVHIIFFLLRFTFIIIAMRIFISGMKHLLFGLFVQLTINHSKTFCTFFLLILFPITAHFSFLGGVYRCNISAWCQKCHCYNACSCSLVVFELFGSVPLFKQLWCFVWHFYGKQQNDLQQTLMTESSITVNYDWHKQRKTDPQLHH